MDMPQWAKEARNGYALQIKYFKCNQSHLLRSLISGLKTNLKGTDYGKVLIMWLKLNRPRCERNF